MKSVPKEVLMGYILMLRHRGVVDARVLNAMERIPRHEFVTENFLDRAYEDTALPTSAGQTLSQPSVVAKMTAVERNQEEDWLDQMLRASQVKVMVVARVGTQWTQEGKKKIQIPVKKE